MFLGAKPKEGYKANTSPFAGETTAKSDYKGWPDHKREASFKPHVVCCKYKQYVCFM